MIQVTLVNYRTDEAEQHLCNSLEVQPNTSFYSPKGSSEVLLFQGMFNRKDSATVITTMHSFRVLAGKFLK